MSIHGTAPDVPDRHPGFLRRKGLEAEVGTNELLEVNRALLDRMVGIQALADAINNMVGTTRRRILWSGTVIIPSNGFWTLNTRQASRAIWVTNYSGNSQVVVAASLPQGNAPGAGPGTHLLPAGVSQVFEGETNDWTLYGTANNSLDVQIFGVPVQPFATGNI